MKRIVRSLLFIFVASFLLWSILVFSIYRDSVTEQREKADALVVMGASQWNGRPSPALRDRLDHAHTIFKDGYVKYIILTGGIAEGDTQSESSVGKKYLVNAGVPESVILIEEKGHTTLESLKEVSRITKEKDLDRILFVSHGYHLYRVRKMAEDLDIREPMISAVPIKNDKKKVKLILRESIVYLVYLLRSGYSGLAATG